MELKTRLAKECQVRADKYGKPRLSIDSFAGVTDTTGNVVGGKIRAAMGQEA